MGSAEQPGCAVTPLCCGRSLESRPARTWRSGSRRFRRVEWFYGVASPPDMLWLSEVVMSLWRGSSNKPHAAENRLNLTAVTCQGDCRQEPTNHDSIAAMVHGERCSRRAVPPVSDNVEP